MKKLLLILALSISLLVCYDTYLGYMRYVQGPEQCRSWERPLSWESAPVLYYIMEASADFYTPTMVTINCNPGDQVITFFHEVVNAPRNCGEPTFWVSMPSLDANGWEFMIGGLYCPTTIRYGIVCSH